METNAARYNRIWEEGRTKLLSGAADLDPFIDSPTDRRRGISLIIRPDRRIQVAFEELTERLQVVAPGQYFHPPESIHVTVMSIISCTPDYDAAALNLDAYGQLAQSCVAGVGSFDLRFCGLTASANCIMAQGYPADASLEKLREKLRSTFRRSDLANTMDERYVLSTAHATLVRFREALRDGEAVVDEVTRMRDKELGRMRVSELLLVENDWYHTAGKTRILDAFSLFA